MSTATSTSGKKLVTAAEFLAMPDDGFERWLIDGVLYPEDDRTSIRTRLHSGAQANLASLLMEWLDRQPEPRGRFHSGQAGFPLRTDPDTFLGIDIAYASAELVAATDPDADHYDGPPVLAVEILSPSDRHGEIVRKIEAYHRAGVIVWEVDPDFRRVGLHRPGQPVKTFNETEILRTEPELPGFSVAVAWIFHG